MIPHPEEVGEQMNQFFCYVQVQEKARTTFGGWYPLLDSNSSHSMTIPCNCCLHTDTLRWCTRMRRESDSLSGCAEIDKRRLLRWNDLKSVSGWEEVKGRQLWVAWFIATVSGLLLVAGGSKRQRIMHKHWVYHSGFISRDFHQIYNKNSVSLSATKRNWNILYPLLPPTTNVTDDVQVGLEFVIVLPEQWKNTWRWCGATDKDDDREESPPPVFHAIRRCAIYYHPTPGDLSLFKELLLLWIFLYSE